MRPTLTLYQDAYADSAEATLPAATRMVFLVHGSATIDGQSLVDGDTWHGEEPVTVRAGATGAALWRWELTVGSAAPISAGNVRTREALTTPLDTLPEGELLLRGDSVAFPAGGCAYRHVHQGPGIRCLIEGGIRIDVHDRSTSYGPGDAWFEAGPDPVFAKAADRPTRFIRVMVLPRTLFGRSSISYVDPADRERPKSQSYQVFVDAPVAFRRTDR